MHDSGGMGRVLQHGRKVFNSAFSKVRVNAKSSMQQLLTVSKYQIVPSVISKIYYIKAITAYQQVF